MSPATGTPGTIRHPDVSEISDLTEGLLSPARSAEIRRHLDDCALCADVRASLAEIRGLLGTLPGPARMPGDIAGRIDAALAAEALLDATQPRDETEPSARPRATHRDVSRETSPSGHPSGPTGPGRRRARRRIAVLGGLAGAAACALGLFLFVDFSGTPHPNSAASDAAAHPSVGAPSGTYTAQGLQGAVQRLIAPGTTAETDPGAQNNTLGMDESPSAPGAAPGDRRVASEVPACVQEATGRSETPLAAERGRFQGTAVHLLVLPHPGDAARVDAYLVDTACESTGSATPGKVLLENTFPRS
ncbi:zf-HC2 domain-containing protein [Streptomyces sp. NRRL F-2664]|uniref:zf-HC2 domain-containing protein n=1 Tax=Streptomyces sp. NRRL F-2664 TaxID=1463842 RepID=UPI0005B89065|nr:zf-HC2 domain-containing protein [Streptomyces sp. NRRL F-2664]